MTVSQAIQNAERCLCNKEAPEGQRDPRWQAIIEVSEYIGPYPNEIWRFTRKWGVHPNADLRTAVAKYLLEHLLEHHFELIFPRVVVACRRSGRFADTFTRCGEFGQTKTPRNVKRFRALKKRLNKIRPPKRRENNQLKHRLAEFEAEIAARKCPGMPISINF